MERDEKLVLIAEDDPHNLEVIRLVLESMVGARAVITVDGESALAQARSTPPDLILLDLMMPRMDGFEAVRRLKSDPATRQIPVVAVSAWTWAKARDMAIAAGCDDFIEKPFDVDQLANVIRKYLSI